MNTQPPLPPHPIASGLGTILRNLAALVARGFLRHPVYAVLAIPLYRHITRATVRLERLLARLAKGKLPPPKPRQPRSSGPRRKPEFPTTRAWLIRALGAEAAAHAAQLEHLLADPAAADLLATPAGRRALAPIQRMLGLTPPRPRRARPQPAPRPRPPRSIPEHHSIDRAPRVPRRPYWLPPPHLRSG